MDAAGQNVDEPAARGLVLILMTPSTYRASDFLAAAGRIGLEVVVGTSRAQALSTSAPGANLALPFHDRTAAVREIARYAARRRIDAVVGVDDDSVMLAADIASALGLRNSSSRAVAATRDKAVMRTRLAEGGLDGPGGVVWDGESDPRPLIEQVSYPCVAKPLSLSASRGVIRADDPAGLTGALARIRGLLDEPDVRERSRGMGGTRVLIEDYVPGEEVALEGLLTTGRLRTLAIFDKPDPLEGPYFEETIFVTPSRKPDAVQRQIAGVVAAGTAALGLGEGPVHAELRIAGTRVVLMEVAARSIGGLCSHALRFGTGMTLEEVILRHAAGLELPGLDREDRAAGVMMIPVPGRGRLGRIEGVDEARALPGIEEVTITLRRGQDLVPPPEGNRYLGFIVARGASPGDVETSLREAHRSLGIEVLGADSSQIDTSDPLRD